MIKVAPHASNIEHARILMGKHLLLRCVQEISSKKRLQIIINGIKFKPFIQASIKTSALYPENF